ncbi:MULTISPECIES: ATP-dependent DNA helicase [unclassified Lentimonas]|uniref:ATP-dependent DNA helicase n=1 Tax=unclassified Lentimonas TaxID=2630993 RepID=UPI001321FB6E|nr:MULTISPECIES: helicase C-terminal domain-containing protein [unclassified Lentimonas]CAA6678460.1 DinG family ATP-dependent helicase CPE1197 [Lentimonas sp. CC4]CAA6685553.1 DinG family ATP-dependent helicase CPE1197 [Lentimonas sp. CC6]CAA7077000.1 DinG family ATP-dependent helicase CPE1197 [Lentimonas sp. CC4]CAA7170551.1 DinG family ATP-dependent helicase CPE1197 [Lentimonas sp. CC21]CAA7180716.1 DinG family ATP-dependent helicase CPE1197 [Lentimonas sp. CC8]
MHIDPLARTVRLSVRELATFRQVPASDGHGASPWRASVGQKWHKTAERQTLNTHTDARFEVPLKATWHHHDWTFEIQGRIDQILPESEQLIIREVKTIRGRLPANPEELASHYPDYFAQVAIYLGLARVLPDYANNQLSAELCFIDIETGKQQLVPLTEDDERTFTSQLDTLLPFLEDRRNCQLRLQGITLQPAFETLREGQAELFATLDHAALQSKTVLLEAPTGFGKTGIVLEHTLRQMQSGVYERAIYLTSKSTGQLETIRQLRAMIGDNLRYIQMRNRSEHRIDSAVHTCTGDNRCNEHLGQNWLAADISPIELFEDATLSLDRAKDIGENTGVCPYALTKGCLPFAEAWIGDTNYIFSPSSRAVFLEQHGFDPAKTLLIVDEAHNLPDRAADALSVELSAADLLFALEELRNAGAPHHLLSIGEELIRCLESQSQGEPLHPDRRYEALDLCEDFARQLKDAHFNYDATAPFAIDIVWRIPELAQRLAEPSHQWLHWCPTVGTLRASCLDASKWIAECIAPFGGSILMSATLSPIESFREHCGLKRKNSTLAQGHAPWRDDAYQVAIDSRVDTRYKEREKHYEITARTIDALIHQSPGVPVAVFFASYLYAENIKTYLEALNPVARVQVQPRGVDLAEQETFIDEGLLMADALFLILGSSYAEGVDKLGGRIDIAMVVGPALPEVNAIQNAKMGTYHSTERDLAFKDVYIIPAMRRIHQALGRIVRAPGHRAKVLLHGKRYSQTAYQQQLAPEYQDATTIRSDADLVDWLQS